MAGKIKIDERVCENTKRSVDNELINHIRQSVRSVVHESIESFIYTYHEDHYWFNIYEEVGYHFDLSI